MAHCLTAEVARVWERCDGTRSTPEIAHVTALEPEIVDAAVAALADRRLLVGHSRREALRLAAAAAPLIYSVAVPTPAAAASAGLHAGCAVASCDASHVNGGISPTALNSQCASGFCYMSDSGPSLRVCAGVSGGRPGGRPELQQRRRPLLRRGVRRASIRM
jgi:precorrin isomerase